MSAQINIIKRNGTVVPYNPERINTFLEFACDALEDVSLSQIAVNSDLYIYNGISTKEINRALLESAHNLISVDNPGYAIAAGRILLCDIRKEVYGDFEPYDLYTIIKDNTTLGLYDPMILEKYSKEDIEDLDNWIEHERDLTYSISGAREWESKYLLKNAVYKQFYESPQVSYMLVSMMYFIDDNGDETYTRLELVKKMYEMLSLGIWNIPTPHLARLRTPTRGFSSCVLLNTGDSIDSISEVATAARKYATLGAGLGIDVSSIRGRGSPIRGGCAINTGPLYHSKSIEETALSCSQGSTRKGSLTFNWWGLHKDIAEILTYKNNMKKDSESMKHSDHTIFMNGFILKKAKNNEDIHLFCPDSARDVYKSFYSNNDKDFEDSYNLAVSEGRSSGGINAREYVTSYIVERFATGRMYAAFADNINKSTMYDVTKYPITQSNLCTEIVLPTKPLDRVYNPEDKTYKQEGLIALCNLGGVNWGSISKPEDFEEYVYVGLRALDNLLSFQSHPFPAAEEHNRLFRPLGIGITGLAYWIAKNDLTYSDCYEELDKWMQYYNYYIIKASVKLSRERGACEGFKDTKWSKGCLPKDFVTSYYMKLFDYEECLDWGSLRNEIVEYGLRNASLMAMFPSETSAKVSGSGTTNGIEPIRELAIQKGGKNSQAIFVAPECNILKDKYDRIWDHKDNSALIKTYAVIQRYTDQAISCNTYYNKSNYSDGKVPYDVILKDFYLHYSLGGKTLYYNNNYDGQSKDLIDGNEIVVESVSDDCESCKL